MARVYLEDGYWIHADNGNRISAWDVRNTEPHASEVKRRADPNRVNTPYNSRIVGQFSSEGIGEDPGDNQGAPVPSGNFTQIEEAYVEEILKERNYA